MKTYTLVEFVENLKSRGYKQMQVENFILSVSTDDAISTKTLNEWNAILDRYIVNGIFEK